MEGGYQANAPQAGGYQLSAPPAGEISEHEYYGVIKQPNGVRSINDLDRSSYQGAEAVDRPNFNTIY